MNSFEDFLTHDHRDCDHRLADVESALMKKDWNTAMQCWESFCQDIERHFMSEEDILFPAIEEFTGSTDGPTEVMRREHDAMRALMSELASALERRVEKDSMGVLDTLVTMIQLHNVKEEQVLYPMADRFLQARREGLMDRIKQLHG